MNETETEPEKPTWQQLAHDLGVARSTLYQWRREPDAPDEPDLGQWLDWMADHHTRASPDPEIERLRCMKLQREIALLDIKIGVENGTLISAREFDGWLGSCAANFRNSLLQWASSEMPMQAVSSTPAEARALWVAKSKSLLAAYWKSADGFLTSRNLPALPPLKFDDETDRR